MDKVGIEHPAVSEQRRVAVRYDAYNPRRYSRPWIGKVVAWPVGGSPEMKWGAYVGDEKGGEVEIMARPGDIIRDGQRDNRERTGTINDWSVVDSEYQCVKIDQVTARTLFAASHSAAMIENTGA